MFAFGPSRARPQACLASRLSPPPSRGWCPTPCSGPAACYLPQKSVIEEPLTLAWRLRVAFAFLFGASTALPEHRLETNSGASTVCLSRSARVRGHVSPRGRGPPTSSPPPAHRPPDPA